MEHIMRMRMRRGGGAFAPAAAWQSVPLCVCVMRACVLLYFWGLRGACVRGANALSSAGWAWGETRPLPSCGGAEARSPPRRRGRAG